MHAAGHEKIARALGRGFGEDGRFDLQKALLAEVVADGQRDVVAQAEVALHLGAAQVHIAILEADLLVLDGFFGRRKRRQAGVVQYAQLGGFNFDFAGGHLGIDGVGRAQAYLAHRGDNVLRADLFAFGVAIGNQLLIQHDLRNAGAVAQVEEDQVAVIAAAIYPAH